VRNKAAHLAVGVDVDGRKEVLGIWVETTEGAKFWLRMMNELKARGIADVLIAVCDGLTGRPRRSTLSGRRPIPRHQPHKHPLWISTPSDVANVSRSRTVARGFTWLRFRHQASQASRLKGPNTRSPLS
jgi:hypothetical protein